MSNILDVISEIDDGMAVERFTETLAAAVRAAQATNKKAKVMLAIGIEPSGRTVMLKAEIKATIPQPGLNVTAFFPASDGLLYRHDPAQQLMRFNPVTNETSAPSKEDPDA